MTLSINEYACLPCHLENFWINDIEAEKTDFGSSWDHREEINLKNYSDSIRKYGCCNNYFIADRSKENIEKCCNIYNINEAEFNEICDMLEEKLCIGECEWCV